MGVRVECYTLAHRKGTCGCAAATLLANGPLKPQLELSALIDETIQTAMDLGAMKAQDGALRLTDRLTELRRQLLARIT